ncbi:MAG: hypothetical protein L0J74_06445 [Corynebacterium sp.]|uniref:hypothetical protein n=1 Tax=Corynebacterium TaxID=1716 RepID=UPI002649B5BD|nr:hypothetical protein [Corynebacterium sp.]MDN6283930.1 hypothetical protein [Corynebacterium sp.]MDN6305433.1 hypothetical protein [Corynebacterium sp.]MDN6353720.1 hypothetical protein [Corynebacterium sp.]MDN6367849.1 hypothetical protein [Corynebacterium sp.]MDN6377157.1 hypothetical protein [Corynebacterium sp.]
MELKKSLLAATTATAVAFGGASIATAQDGSDVSALSSESSIGDDNNILGSLEDEDGILGSFVGDDAFGTIGNITTVISLIVAGFNLSNVITLPKLPF